MNYEAIAEFHQDSRYRMGLASRRLEIYFMSLSSIMDGLPVHLLRGLTTWLKSSQLCKTLETRPIEH